MKKFNPELRLQIATPIASGRIDHETANCIFETAQLLENLNIEVDWARLPGCSDLPAARAKIVGAFYRGNDDYLLMVDDDMHFEPTDVLRMLQFKKDFICAAGPRKIIGPSEYCFNNCTDEGETRAILFDSDGLLHITEVGAAFVMLSKNCVKKMMEHYRPTLEFEIIGTGIASIMEVALFDPYILPGTKRRLPEDYAFSKRWRDIGGTIFLLPDVVLGHSGNFVWKGSVADTMRKVGVIEEDGMTVMQEGHIAPEAA